MYQMIRSYGLLSSLKKEAPAATTSLVIAELFFKFHSFVLECVAFLATWYVLSWLLARLVGVTQKRESESR